MSFQDKFIPLLDESTSTKSEKDEDETSPKKDVRFDVVPVKEEEAQKYKMFDSKPELEKLFSKEETLEEVCYFIFSLFPFFCESNVLNL